MPPPGNPAVSGVMAEYGWTPQPTDRTSLSVPSPCSSWTVTDDDYPAARTTFDRSAR
jgi:hypothetical protein